MHSPIPLRLLHLAIAAAVVMIPRTAAQAQVLGNLDGVHFDSGQYWVTGWACEAYSYTPSTVTLSIDSFFDTSTQTYTSLWSETTIANQPSEDAVANACGAPGGTNFRFSFAVPTSVEQMYIYNPISVIAQSGDQIYDPNTGTYYYDRGIIGNSDQISLPDNSITGNIDGVSGNAIGGWACAKGIAQSVPIHVYAYSPSGSFVTSGSASLASEPAVAQACGVGSGSYRYSIPITPAMACTYGGGTIYVYGISPVGQNNLLLTNSGRFLFPKLIWGSCCNNSQCPVTKGTLT